MGVRTVGFLIGHICNELLHIAPFHLHQTIRCQFVYCLGANVYCVIILLKNPAIMRDMMIEDVYFMKRKIKWVLLVLVMTYAIVVSLLTFTGCAGGIQAQYVSTAAYDSDAGATVAPEKNTELANAGYAVDMNTDISNRYELATEEAVSDAQLPYAPSEGPDYNIEDTDVSKYNIELSDTDYTVNANIDNRDYHQWTIEELGEIIVSGGMFWEDWWYGRGKFSDEHIDRGTDLFKDSDFWYLRYNNLPLLPSSGVDNWNDFRGYLLQFYSERWVDDSLMDWRMDSKIELLHNTGTPFAEYSGAVFVNTIRAGFSRPKWETAIHTMVEQDGNRAVVETNVLHSSWHMLPNLVWCGNRENFFIEVQEQISHGDAYINPDISVAEMIGEVRFRFILMDGRVDSIERRRFNDFEEWNIWWS